MEENNPISSGTVTDFKKLRIYQKALVLSNQVYDLTRRPAFSKDYNLLSQIRSASVSVISNIAEGFERGANKEFIQFLYIAKGSCGEARSQLDIALAQKYIDAKTHQQLDSQYNGLTAMIGRLIGYLSRSQFKGPKHVQAQSKTRKPPGTHNPNSEPGTPNPEH